MRIRGKVTRVTSEEKPTPLLVRAIPRDENAYLGYYAGSATYTKPDGSFELTGIRSGSYEVSVFKGQAQTLVGMTPAVVNRDSLEQVLVNVGEVTVKGRIVVEPKEGETQSPNLDLSGSDVSLLPWEGVPLGIARTTVKKDGIFEIQGVGLSKFRVMTNL